jgi:hypothetical protein
MEHFANEFDLVARLGILSPLRSQPEKLIEIDGPLFEREVAWSHLLNEHYMTPIDDFLYPGGRSSHCHEEDPYRDSGSEPKTPRLYKYFHGKRPD